MTTITNKNRGILEIPSQTLQDYIIQILDNDEKLNEVKKFFHVCRKTKNCDCLGAALRAEHNARVDSQIAKNLANPVFKQRFGC